MRHNLSSCIHRLKNNVILSVSNHLLLNENWKNINCKQTIVDIETIKYHNI